jgi:sarcosine oxidase subunit beta
MTGPSQACEIAIIGGGIAGCATALYLARKGRSVLVLERDNAGLRASGINFGGVRQNGRDFRELPLSMRAARLWPRIEELIGFDGEFRQTGNLRLAMGETIGKQEHYYLAAIQAGLELEHLDGGQLRARFPWISREIELGLLCPSDGHANPRLVAPAFAFAAQEAGAAIVENCAIERAGFANGFFQIAAGDGREFRAETLVNAAGAWGAKVAGWFGENVEIIPEVPQVLVTEPAPYAIEPVLGLVGGDLYLRQTLRGNILFGGGEGRANADWTLSRPLPEVSRSAAERAIRIVPGLRHLTIIRTWTGVDGDTRDGVAVVGPSARQPGLYHAFGFSGHGFQLGPAVGEVISELIAHGRTETDISGLGIGRLLDTGPSEDQLALDLAK